MTDLSGVRVGFIGLGNIARLHADQVRKLGATVAAGTDVVPEARESFVQEYGAETFVNHEDMFDIVDAVIVSTPNLFHEEYVVSALEADIDVLVEKPLGHTLDSANNIAEVAEESEGFCMVGFHNRFRAPVQVLHEHSERGDLGNVAHVEANYVRRRGVPGRGSWFTQGDIAGGGCVIDIGTHAIDLALHLVGFPEVVEVSATTRSQFGSRPDYEYLHMWGDDQGAGEFDVEDSSSAFVRCADGTTMTIELAWASNREPSQEYVVRGNESGARLDLAEDSLTIYDTQGGGAAHHRDTQVETRETDAHGLEQEYFLEAVADGRRPEMNTVEQGLAVQRVIDAIYRSSDSGEAVAVGERASDRSPD